MTATVSDAWDVYEQACLENPDAENILFQGEDTIAQKEKKTKDIIEKFGKDRNRRPSRANVIATPIIEKSMDVDFDDLASAHAPIDSLFQRLGRRMRHDDRGTVREKRTSVEPAIIFIPENYGNLTKIYNRRVLEETEKVLSRIIAIDTVKDIRKLIDTVYDAVPEEELNIARSEVLAGLNTIGSPYSDTGLIEEDQIHYDAFNRSADITRETTYPTVQVAIVDEDILKDNSFDAAKMIYREKAVNIVKYKLDLLDLPYAEKEMTPDVQLYIENDGPNRISDGAHSLELTKDGMRWRVEKPY